MRPLAIVCATACALVAFAPPALSSTVLFDDFFGGTLGSITGMNNVSFTATSAVLSTPHDGVVYSPTLFPADGVIEVRLRVDSIGAINQPGDRTDFGVVIDSAGADARIAGDLFLAVLDTGLVHFTITPIGGVRPLEETQVISTTSLLDGMFHVVGVRYGSGGIELRVDGTVEATDGFAGSRAISRDVAVGDFPDQAFNDAQFGFAFLGEVDWVRSGTDFSVVPEPTTGPLLAAGLVVLAATGSRIKIRNRRVAGIGEPRTHHEHAAPQPGA